MIRLDRCGFVPGEAIQFNAEIQNMTSRVCGIHVKLTMVRKNDFSYFIFVSIAITVDLQFNENCIYNFFYKICCPRNFVYWY